ncbi:MAG: hypothetical protein JSS12_02380 [Verrucomicrobia bacterium]|nr:hypothetical protein [Verrucomicrobiota bacterium]
MNPIREQELYSLIQQLNDQELGGAAICTPSQSALGQEIIRRVHEILKDCPKSPAGNVFIRSTFSVCPTLKLLFSDLQPIVSGLFAPESGKWIEVEPLQDQTFGDFTHEKTRLELTNVHFADGATFKDNTWTYEKVRQLEDSCIINSSTRIGDVDVSPNRKSSEIIADIRFGSFEAKEQHIEVHTRNDETLELIIKLSHISLKGNIGYDGDVTLSNDAHVSIDEIAGVSEDSWIGIEHDVSVEFTVKKPKTK